VLYYAQIPALGSLMIPYAELALRGTRFNYESKYEIRKMYRGLDLALGGIYDHVGGGFQSHNR